MKKIFCLFIFTVFAAQARAECRFDNMTMDVSGKDCPKEVADLVERVNACGHFESEPYDLNEEWGRQRNEFLDKNIRELRCMNLASEQKVMNEKYKNNRKILNFLKEHGSF